MFLLQFGKPDGCTVVNDKIMFLYFEYRSNFMSILPGNTIAVTKGLESLESFESITTFKWKYTTRMESQVSFALLSLVSFQTLVLSRHAGMQYVFDAKVLTPRDPG